jgi:hypothetical protein
MKTVLTLLALLLLFSCAAPVKYVWECQDKDKAQTERFLKECKYEVSKATASGPVQVFGGPSAAGAAMATMMMRQGDLLTQCMDLKGCKYIPETEMNK